jgi:hypothetical protein
MGHMACSRKAIHEQQFQSPLSTHLFVERFIQDLNASEQRVQKVSVSPVSGVAPKWLPPPHGMIKINFHAAAGKGTGVVQWQP